MNASIAARPFTPSMASPGCASLVEAEAPQEPGQVVLAVAHAGRVRVTEQVVAAVDVEGAAHRLGEVGQRVPPADEIGHALRQVGVVARRGRGAPRPTGRAGCARSSSRGWARRASPPRRGARAGPCPRSCRSAAAMASRARSLVTRCQNGRSPSTWRSRARKSCITCAAPIACAKRVCSAPGNANEVSPSCRMRRRRCTSRVASRRVTIASSSLSKATRPWMGSRRIIGSGSEWAGFDAAAPGGWGWAWRARWRGGREAPDQRHAPRPRNNVAAPSLQARRGHPPRTTLRPCRAPIIDGSPPPLRAARARFAGGRRTRPRRRPERASERGPNVGARVAGRNARGRRWSSRAAVSRGSGPRQC